MKKLKGWTDLKPAHRGLILWHIFIVFYYALSQRPAAEAHFDPPPELRVVDLTHTFDKDTIYWVTEPRLTLNVTYNGTAPGRNYWYQKDEIYAATHGGTHLDAPCHFAKGRWCVSDIPLEHLVVPAVVVDISSEVGDDSSAHLSTEHLIAWEKIYGQIPDGSLLLINTGWSKFWPNPLKFTGTADRMIEQLAFPSIERDVAKWLVANRNIVGIGIDTMSIDIPNSNREIHTTLMEKNVYGLENVNNLHLVPPTGSLVFVLPMKLRDASGAPCRIVAQISGGPRGSAVRVMQASNLLLVFVTLKLLLSLNFFMS